MIRPFAAALLAVALPSGSLRAQAVDPQTLRNGVDYSVWTGDGVPSSLDEVLVALDGAEVLLVGEEHDDMIGHAIEAELFGLVVDRYSAPGRPARSVVLSMEMFERDVQYVLDEYLQGLIAEQHFLDSARPWDDYGARYGPLVELAREKGLPVVAANAPRRYVNRVTREGPGSLGALPAPAASFLPPLPYPGPSPLYREQWDAVMAEAMGGMPADHDSIGRAYSMSENAVYAQALWDASMGYSVAQALDAGPVRVAIHLAGSFHVERGTGISERIQDYRPGTRVKTLVMAKAEDVALWDGERSRGLADFVVLTKQPVDPHGG